MDLIGWAIASRGSPHNDPPPLYAGSDNKKASQALQLLSYKFSIFHSTFPLASLHITKSIISVHIPQFPEIFTIMAISTNGTNGTSKAGKPFPPGVHVPSLTWFLDDSNQEIDWDTQKKHLSFLIESGLHGSKFPDTPFKATSFLTSTVVLAGTNGEAVALTASEKAKLVSTTRELAISLGRPDLTVILGCGGGSTRAVIEETKLAKEAGADYALVMVPSYFHFAMNEEAIVAFFREVHGPNVFRGITVAY